jgi:hypothetical protein
MPQAAAGDTMSVLSDTVKRHRLVQELSRVIEVIT